MASILLNRHRLRAPELLIPGRAPVGPTVLNRSHPLAKGLVGWWPLNAGSGLTAADASGNGNDGTLQNMTEGDWVPGLYGSGYALDFDGSNDIVNVGDIDITGGITISGWVDPTSVAGGVYRVIVSKRPAAGGVNYAFEQTTAGDQLRFFFTSGGWQVWRTLGFGLTASPQHVAVTYDETAYPKFYRNGVISGTVYRDSGSGSPPMLTDDVDTYVGGTHATGNSSAWLGVLDSVRIYDRALTAAEIRRTITHPYEILQPPGPEYLTFSTAAAPATSVPLMYHHYQMAGGL